MDVHSLGKYCPMWGAFPYHPMATYTSPHTPNIQNIQTPLHSHFSGIFFGKYTYLCSLTLSAQYWGELWPNSPTYARFPNLLYTAEPLSIKQK